jgi:hypothetical protein
MGLFENKLDNIRKIRLTDTYGEYFIIHAKILS